MAEPLVFSYTYRPHDMELAARYSTVQRLPLRLGLALLPLLLITIGAGEIAFELVLWVIGTILGLVISCVTGPKRYARQIHAAQPTALTEPTTVTVTDDGMEMVSAVSCSRRTWRAFQKVVYAGSFVGLQTGGDVVAMIIVPRHALGKRHAEFVARFRDAGIPVVETRSPLW